MSRNQNSHFAMVPRANVPRSRMDLSNNVKTTGNCGLLIPIEHWEVLPGDSFKMSVSMLARMQTLITPLMDDLYADVYFFYAPNRLLWEHWEQFCGDDQEPWFDERPEYSVPQHKFYMNKQNTPASSPDQNLNVAKGTVADHIGWPLPYIDSSQTDGHEVSVSALPLRMYTRVWNEWFKSESLQNNAAFSWSDQGSVQNSNGTALEGGQLLPVNKYRDMFTSCLPAPEYNGNQVTIGIGDIAPVFTGSANNPVDVLKHGETALQPMRFMPSNDSYNWADNTTYQAAIHSLSNNNGVLSSLNATSTSDYHSVVPTNLFSDISAATGITINELRMAFATQRYWEAIARHGSRYTEWLAGIWGVTAPDQRLQRTEYLGGTRVHININQVVQNSETNTTPLGNLGAYSLTTDTQNIFDKSFVESGIIMAFVCVRYDHSYQDGVDPQDQRLDFWDYYNPMFNGVGEQAVKNLSIFASGSDEDKEVFGYNEYACDYRFKNNRVTGEFRSRYDQTLDYWHLADNYTQTPRLGQDWIKEDGEVVDRAIAVSERVSDQFLFDFWFNCIATRPMPIYSIPGLTRL